MWKKMGKGEEAQASKVGQSHCQTLNGKNQTMTIW